MASGLFVIPRRATLYAFVSSSFGLILRLRCWLLHRPPPPAGHPSVDAVGAVVVTPLRSPCLVGYPKLIPPGSHPFGFNPIWINLRDSEPRYHRRDRSCHRPGKRRSERSPRRRRCLSRLGEPKLTTSDPCHPDRRGRRTRGRRTTL